MSARYAICFTPPPDSPLNRFGSGVLGYDCFDATDVPRLAVSGIDPALLALATAGLRRDGFRAQLVGPFRLRNGTDAKLREAFSAFASGHLAVPVGPMEVASVDAFIVLRLVEPSAQLEELAAACVTTFQEFRAPLTPDERDRYLAVALSARQIELLDRWGDPYVLDEFRFHMMVAGPIPDSARDTMKAGLARAFEPLAKDFLEVGALSLMRQDDPAAAFRVLSRQRLTGR